MSYNPEGLSSIDFQLEVYSPPSGNNLIFDLKARQDDSINLVGNSAVNAEIIFRQDYNISVVNRVVTNSLCNLNRELITSLIGVNSVESAIDTRLNLVTKLLLKGNSSTRINTFLQLYTTLKSTNYIETRLNLVTKMITSLTTNLIIASNLSFADKIISSTASCTNLNLFQAYKVNLKSNFIIVTKVELLQDRRISLQGTIDSSFILSLVKPILIKINSLGQLDLFKGPVGLKLGMDSKLVIRFKLIPNYSLQGINRRIYVLDESLELVGELDDLKYFKWQRRFREHDSFEIKINRYKKNARLLGIGKYLAVRRGDIVRCGKISSRKLAPQEVGKEGEIWLFGGQSGNGILEKRLVLPDRGSVAGYDEITAPAETIIKYYLKKNLVEPEDERRKVDYLEVAQDRGRGIEVTVKGRFEKISELVKSICLLSDLGWDIEFDLRRKKFLFEVRVGEDRSGLVLAPRFDNVKLISFEEDEFRAENVIYVSNGEKSVSIGGA